MTDQGSEETPTTNVPTPPSSPPTDPVPPAPDPVPTFQQPPAYQPPAFDAPPPGAYQPQPGYQQPAYQQQPTYQQPPQPGWGQPPAAQPGPAWGQPPAQGGPSWGQPQQQPGQPTWGQPQPPAGPAWGQPPQPPAPAWSQPQPQYWGNPEANVSRPRQTSILAVLAGVLLLLVGLLPTFFGVLVIIGGAAVNGLGDMTFGGQVVHVGSGLAGAIVVIGVVVLVIGLLEVLSGIFIWAHHSWARFVGLAFGLLGTLAGLGTLGSRDGVGGGLVILVIYGFILVALIISGGHFRPSRR